VNVIFVTAVLEHLDFDTYSKDLLDTFILWLPPAVWKKQRMSVRINIWSSEEFTCSLISRSFNIRVTKNGNLPQ